MYDLATVIALFSDLAAALAPAIDEAAADDFTSEIKRLRLIALFLTFSGIALTSFQYLKGDDIRRVAMSAAMVAMLMVTSLILGLFLP
jgi:hypothetical protein